MKDMQEATQQDPTLIPDKRSMKTYLPHNRHMIIDYPGVANVRVGNVTIPGNRAIKFGQGYVAGLAKEDLEDLQKQAGEAFRTAPAEYLFNLYFLHRANLIITDWRATDECVTVMITTQLEREQVDDLSLVQQVVDSEMSKLRQQREEEREKEAEKQVTLEKETARLLALAQKAEKQGWENRITELEELNKKLSKDIKALKKASQD